jgi:hypothetical protein
MHIVERDRRFMVLDLLAVRVCQSRKPPPRHPRCEVLAFHE